MMVIEERDQYKLSGKSGLSNKPNNKEGYNGWFVGYIEMESSTYFFATNIEPKAEFEFDTFVKKRKDLTFEALKAMNTIN